MGMNYGNDVFGYKRNPKPRGVFSMENSRLVFGGTDVGTSLGYLVQNWDISYSQQVQEIFEIGSNQLYWAKSRPQGNGTIGRIIGDADVDTNNSGFFPKSAYDICDGGATMSLTAKGGHCDVGPAGGGAILSKGVNIVMSGCVVTNIGFNMQVGDIRLFETFNWRFAYMQLSAQTD